MRRKKPYANKGRPLSAELRRKMSIGQQRRYARERENARLAEQARTTGIVLNAVPPPSRKAEAQ